MAEFATAKTKFLSSLRGKVLAMLFLAALVLGGLFGVVVMVTHTYLICGDPAPSKVTINGHKQDLASNGCFIYNGWLGQDLLAVTFQNGVQRQISLFPKLTDDNSTAFKVTPTSETMYGDLRYKVE